MRSGPGKRGRKGLCESGQKRMRRGEDGGVLLKRRATRSEHRGEVEERVAQRVRELEERAACRVIEGWAQAEAGPSPRRHGEVGRPFAPARRPTRCTFAGTGGASSCSGAPGGAVLASVVVLASAYLRLGAAVGGVLCRRASEGAAAAKIQHLQWVVCTAVEHGSVREVGAC